MRINLLSSAARCAATSRKSYQFVLNFRYCIDFVIVVFSQLFACIFCPGQAVPTIVTFFDRFFAKAFHLFSATSSCIRLTASGTASCAASLAGCAASRAEQFFLNLRFRYFSFLHSRSGIFRRRGRSLSRLFAIFFLSLFRCGRELF